MRWALKRYQKDREVFSIMASKLFSEPEKIKDFAHNLSDISDEIVEIAEYIQKVRIHKKCTSRELTRLVQCLCYHWPDHLKAIRKITESANIRQKTKSERNRKKRKNGKKIGK